MPEARAAITLPAHPDAVWQLIGGFGSLPDWLPYIPASHLADGGRTRRLANPAGQPIVERLERYDHAARSYTYFILEAPFPVTGYESTLRVLPASPGGSRVEWSGRFTPHGVSEPEAVRLFTTIYEEGLAALATRFPLNRRDPMTTIHYRTLRVRDLDVFYREAGPAGAPVILLLHGFPTSSNMFRNLIPLLATSYRVIAPDYPGYGQTTTPPVDQFEYSFANLASVIEEFVHALDLPKFSLYVMDYGAPIGYRLALRLPDRIQALLIQNGNAYEEGLREFWDPIKRYWADPSPENQAALHFLVSPEATRWQYEDGVADKTLLDPTTWLADQVGLDRPGNREIQMALFLSYGTNVPLYPDFQAFFRQYQPPALICWGKNDYIFPPDGAAPYQRDLPAVETHLLDTGHFALETHGAEIAGRITAFLERHGIG